MILRMQKIYLENNMKQRIYSILREHNLDCEMYNIDLLYKVGIDNIICNLDFYYDKPYACDSVIRELFTRGVIDYVTKKTKSL